jgi:hypothetical protein
MMPCSSLITKGRALYYLQRSCYDNLCKDVDVLQVPKLTWNDLDSAPLACYLTEI